MVYDRKSYETLANNDETVKVKYAYHQLEKKYAQQAAEIERLKSIIDEKQAQVQRWGNEAHTLRARVEELKLDNNALSQEVRELRTRFKGAEQSVLSCMHERDVAEREAQELRTRLASYEKAEPTIVKQTWHTTKIGGKTVRCVRQDYYSDETVTTVLEPIGGWKC